MRLLFIFLLCIVSSVSFAQTKKIAFKSHSGSNENFSIALEDNLFDMDESNFGLGPLREITTRTLDSVKYVSKSMSILVISRYTTEERSPMKGTPVFQGLTKDTVYSHPLFSHKHSLDSIKSILKSQKTYDNPVEKIVFVGFDNKKGKKAKRYELLLPAGVDNKNNDNSNNLITADKQIVPFGTSVILIVAGIIILSLLSGLVAWKYAQSRQVTPLLSAS